MPYNACHFVAIDLDNRVGDLDLRGGAARHGARDGLRAEGGGRRQTARQRRGRAGEQADAGDHRGALEGVGGGGGAAGDAGVLAGRSARAR